MSKELPYFKFEPSEWITGDITLCSIEAQGLFINLCAYYWIKDCSICLSNAKQRFSNCISLFDELQNKCIIKVKEDDTLIINFLDEQMEKFISISEKRSVSGSLKGKQLISKSKANDKHLLHIRGEERREEKKDNKEKIYIDDLELNDLFIQFLEMRKKIKKPATEKAISLLLKNLNTLSDNKSTQIKILEQSIINNWQDLYLLRNDKSKTKINDYTVTEADFSKD